MRPGTLHASTSATPKGDGKSNNYSTRWASSSKLDIVRHTHTYTHIRQLVSIVEQDAQRVISFPKAVHQRWDMATAERVPVRLSADPFGRPIALSVGKLGKLSPHGGLWPPLQGQMCIV